MTTNFSRNALSIHKSVTYLHSVILNGLNDGHAYAKHEKRRVRKPLLFDTS